MKHTPGKWQVETAATSRDGKTVITEYFVRRDGDSMAIANDITDPDTETMSEANARLIAAAPDMLAALEHVIEQHGGQMPHKDCICVDCDYLRPIHAAVAKALGQNDERTHGARKENL